MTNLRKSIGAAVLGLALAGAMGFGASELYASAAASETKDCPSVCPMEEKAAAAAACPVDKPASCPDGKGA